MNYSHLSSIIAFQAETAVSNVDIIHFESTARGGYGVCEINSFKYFFKYKANSNFNQEYALTESHQLPFSTANIVFYKRAYSLGEDIMIWEYKDEIYTGKSLLHNFVYNKNVPLDIRLEKFKTFWQNYWLAISSSAAVINRITFANHDLFEGRLFNGRLKDFYGQQLELLYDDCKKVMPNCSALMPKIVKKALESFQAQKQFVSVISHGDLHDFNLSFSPDLFFDLEYSGLNSLAGEVACYLWYIYAQSGTFIAKYNKRFFEKSRLVDNENTTQSQLKRIFWEEFVSPVIDKYNQLHLNLDNELFVRLLARILGVRNVLLFEEADRHSIYLLVEKLAISLDSGQFFEDLRTITIVKDFTDLLPE